MIDYVNTMSRWIIITIAAIVIASVLTIGLVVFLLRKSDEEERAADEMYLKQKQNLLKLAVTTKLQQGDGVVQSASGDILKRVNDTGATVDKSNSKLADLISRQKATIAAIKQKYEAEKNKLLGKSS
jgi:Kef-type K+ transport system membrane component KefB